MRPCRAVFIYFLCPPTSIRDTSLLALVETCPQMGPVLQDNRTHPLHRPRNNCAGTLGEVKGCVVEKKCRWGCMRSKAFNRVERGGGRRRSRRDCEGWGKETSGEALQLLTARGREGGLGTELKTVGGRIWSSRAFWRHDSGQLTFHGIRTLSPSNGD